MMDFANLDRLVAPRNVVVVGASGRQASQGQRLYENLVRHSRLSGKVYAVNPAYDHIGDAPCYPSVADVPADDIDVALVIVNAGRVPDVLRQCATRGIPFAIVMTSGFSEAGEEGRALEAQLRAISQETGLRVYGPNCPGLVNVRDRIGMTFSPAFRHDLNGGRIGLATQGGGLGRNILQGLVHGAGVGLWFSAGNEADLDIADFIAYMARDPAIDVIALLMEGIKDGRRLAQALTLARDQGKPVVVLKVGRSEAGVRAAQSHTASVAGSAAVNSAVFRQLGAIEVDDLDQLLSVTHLMTRPRPAPGTGLCIYTFSGGTAALAADIAGAAGVPMAEFAPHTRQALQGLLPAFASIANPVDTTADILRDTAAADECLAIVCRDPNVGAVLFPIPMDYGEVTESIARSIVNVGQGSGTPIVPVWMSRRRGGGFEILEQHGLLPFGSVSAAVAALSAVFPASTPDEAAGDAKAREAAVAGTGSGALHADPDEAPLTRLSETQAKHLLAQAGLPVPQGHVAASAQEAADLARRIGYPVVMKIVSPDIAHKTDAGGVRLNVADEAAARQAYDDIQAAVARHAPRARRDGVLVERMLPAGGREVLIGVHRDPAFGLVLTFGLGGVYVEVLGDVAHKLVPLAPRDARAIVHEIRYGAILQGVRGQGPADLEALAGLILQVSDFAHAHAATLHELELNPVWVGAPGQGVMALDALLAFAPAANPPDASSA
ncbi:acetate--CoA ligase family protein [Bordetella genomosp. 13]|uniref:acetate--CoA ligase family protein n=1 Tax=Bordetella genomosp. 13 TaxID=463040 RepID=UPI0011A05E47|nr:acetate--CoA ligase family protein [Bordetella genomosp. 13]